MLEDLWYIWRREARPLSEVRVWLEQHCVDADDFAFSMACCMRDYLRQATGE